MKTVAPRLPESHVPRSRLTEALEAATSDQVILICAPAGYGKTLLLAEWASRRPTPPAWVSLDADDNDDHRFWSAVLTALASSALVPEGSQLRAIRVPARPSRDPTFLAAVVNAVDLLPGPVPLVLDDVHELTAPDPLHGLTSLVRDRPPSLHLVMATRSDPPLALGRMRLHGEICEIRAEALRFSVPEAGAMLAAADVAVRDDQLRLLVEQTEGWAAGLRLAAMALREVDDPDRFLADFAGDSRAVSDYLVGEILACLPADVLDLLRAVSVCDPLSASLAAALTGRPDAGEVLDTLERDTSLILSSGPGRIWYRIHPLLRSHLLADLQRRRPDRLVHLHGQAADWYAAAGEPLPAVAHARRSGDPGRLARLLRQSTVALVADGAHRALREAIEELGDRHVAVDPWLALVAALVNIEGGTLGAADGHLAQADAAWPAEPAAELIGLRELVRARRVSLTGDPAVMVDVTEGLTSLDEGGLGLAVMGDLDRALALVTVDRQDEARVIAEGAVHRARRSRQGYLVARGLTVLASIEGTRGDYRKMVEFAEQADEVLPGVDWTATAGAALSSILRAYGALLNARPHACLELLGPALAFGDDPEEPVNAAAATARALRGAALVELGRVTEGLDQLRHARAATADHPRMTTTSALLAVLEHRAATLSGRQDLARTVLTWAEHAVGDSGEVALMRAHRLGAMGRLAAAAAALQPLLDRSVPVHLPWAVAEAWVLDCRIAHLGGRREQARTALDRALELCEAMDVLRPLASGPVEVIDLLTSLLGSFGSREPVALRALHARQALGGGARPIGLTDRERAVLRLLPSQRSFDEIATDLSVSHSTVKTHVRAIYSKLGVNSRREAVDQARGTGLLFPAGEP
ncbi:LuxR C-terminal-related transcriptional regulator [Modestobacter marinus]|uniref:LuxR C-terminal-related transcriptional regulator n=1 Tax=Modestobacter marinus TaxID=477641 RepID=UPI0027E07762|nr:LuxR C-terminal-related transcriptional regulator [Modestobacter marinus]